jgi:hypothetical protein
LVGNTTKHRTALFIGGLRQGLGGFAHKETLRLQFNE